MKEFTLPINQIEFLKKACRTHNLNEVIPILNIVKNVNSRLIMVESLLNSDQKEQAAKFLLNIVNNSLAIAENVTAINFILRHQANTLQAYNINEQTLIKKSYNLLKNSCNSIDHYMMRLITPESNLKSLSSKIEMGLNNNNCFVDDVMSKYGHMFSDDKQYFNQRQNLDRYLVLKRIVSETLNNGKTLNEAPEASWKDIVKAQKESNNLISAFSRL